MPFCIFSFHFFSFIFLTVFLFSCFALYRFFDDRPTSIDVERALETPAPDRGGPAGCGTLAVATREDADFFG